MEGYLNKAGEKGLLNFKRRRWFVLDPSLQRLRYSKDKGQPEIGFINLVEAEKIEEAYKTNPRDLGGFNIICKNRVWILDAENAARREAWVRALQACMGPDQKRVSVTMQPTTSGAQTHAGSISQSNGQATLDDLESLAAATGGIMFEFEEDLDRPSNLEKSFVEDDEGDEEEGEDIADLPSTRPPGPSAPIGGTRSTAGRRGADDSSIKMMATSVPLNIPNRGVAQTWHQKAFAGWPSDSDSDEEQEVGSQFEKPHEVVAKTYQEHYMRTGDIQFDVPVSSSKRVKALI